MSNGNTGNGKCPPSETKITCRNYRRCHTKIPIKIGNKNNGSRRVINCPECGMPNVFWIDERGKVRTTL